VSRLLHSPQIPQAQFMPQPSCVLATCNDEPPHVLHATRNTSMKLSYKLGARVKYTCVDGYHSNNDIPLSECVFDTSTLTANWTRPVYDCSLPQCPAPRVAYAKLVMIHKKNSQCEHNCSSFTQFYYNTNESLSDYCASGFEATTPIRCTSDGTWSAQANCTDTDECTRYVGVCGNGSNCINLIGSYVCTCPTGYYSIDKNVCRDVDECTSTAKYGCSDVCVNRPGTAECECTDKLHMWLYDAKQHHEFPDLKNMYVNRTCFQARCTPPPPIIGDGG
jgi:hypothetical protein